MPMRLAPVVFRSVLRGLCPLGLGLVLGLFAVAPLACDSIPCNTNQCVGGLEWYAQAAGGGALLPGTYVFEFELDGTRVGSSCLIAETLGDSECDPPMVLEGDGGFEVELGLRGVMEGFQQPSDHVGRIELRAYEDVAEGVRGPEAVHIVGTRDGQSIIDVTYEMTYERDESYHGDERCGFCDLTETRRSEIAG